MARAQKREPPRMSLDELLSLPVTMDIVVAGRAFGLGRTKAYELHQAGEFPCEVLPLGRYLRVRKADLMRALGLSVDGKPLPEAADQASHGDAA